MSVPTDDPLSTPVQFVRGVGPLRAELFARIGVHTVSDLLWYLPRDVLDFTHVSAVHELSDDRPHSVRGEVVDKDARMTSTGKTLTAVLLKADGGFVRGVWFNQGYMLRKFELGQRVLFTGKAKLRERRWEFSHPQTQWLEDDDAEAAPGVLPRYGLTDGLRMHEVRRAAAAAVDEYAALIPDPLPETFRTQWTLPALSAAVAQLHRPATMDEYHAGRRRVLFDDLFEFEAALALRRRAWHRENKAVPLPNSSKIDARIRRLFPFPFTAGQNQAVTEIVTDLAQDRAMHRLLQADVGAGKTAVAVYAMLVAIANQTQAVLMAPTEVLAQQHWQTIEQLLEHSRVERRFLTGQLTMSERTKVRGEIADGTAQLIIGTQAVIQEGVTFHRLGLAVVDEQHKFGVGQRGRFQSGEWSPHRLVMTATPIPRSLCLTQFGDLDLTSIHELPPGRQRIVTSRVAGAGAVAKAWEFIRKKLQEGRQAYVVCPRIMLSTPQVVDGSGTGSGGDASPVPPQTVGAETGDDGAEAVFRTLSAGELKGFRIGLVHGQQDRVLRAATMDAFRRGELDVLVATTVIEVGVDVPNATLMMIYAAERFGLSQLHQLRGRIGRGRFQGYCFLQSTAEHPDAVRRLAAMEASSDGFHLAEVDFELRGPGNVLGSEQSGSMPLRVADLVRDKDVLIEARDAAFGLVNAGTIDEPEFVPVKLRVLERFREMMDLPQSG